MRGAGFSFATTHQIALQLKNGTVLKANLKGPVFYSNKKNWHLNPATDFQPNHQCLKPTDIAKVSIVAGGDDNWYITKISTSTKVGMEAYKGLTNDPTFFKWLDNRSPASSELVLSLGTSTTNVDYPLCGFGRPVCECKIDADLCIFSIEVDEILTFVSYPKLQVGDEGSGIIIRGLEATLWHITENGKQEPLEQYDNTACAANFTSTTCSDPQFVDGKTYRVGIGVNGQIPGPTLVVHERQKVVVHVKNNLTSEGISVHWHGIHQTGTPWMDGVGQITQCHIQPGTSYSYIYLAKPSGTFWYHSHSGAQRTDGLFGAMIVKERSDRMKKIKTMLSKEGVKDFEDHPTKHTLSLLDWQQESALDLFSQLNDGLGFYPGVPIGQVPPSNRSSQYFLTFGVEMAAIGPTPYFSGLINGKGRHSSIPYSQTRLSVFSVVRGRSYRFRLIGAQGLYAYKFSIDGHKLTVVNTDGYWIKPIKDVDYIILHTGERYDFILEANCDSADKFWMRAETLEVDVFGKGPPYKSLDHTAEGILQYVKSGEESTEIDSTEYECIKDDSIPILCTSEQKCKAVNCPFEDYHPSYNTHCVNVHEFQLLEPTPPKEMPLAYPSSGCKECLYFMNFNFEGISAIGSVNGRNFVLPPAPPQTQPDDFYKEASLCDLNANCNPFQTSCLCTQLIDIPYEKTVQFIWTSIGGNPEVHPIHLHGHTFHVVHIGYPTYNKTTGKVDRERETHNQDIACNDCVGKPKGSNCNNNLCTDPKWKDNKSPTFTISSTTIRKDTVMIPAGGYVAINFISDNPGYWFLHCHIEDHTLEGMGILINEAFKEQQSLPGRPSANTINKCGNVDLTGGVYEAVAALKNN